MASQALDRVRCAVSDHVAGIPNETWLKPWRQWLLIGLIGGHWYAVPKSDPTARPQSFPHCTLAQVKARLLAAHTSVA